MTTTEMIGGTRSFLSDASARASRWWQFLWKILSFSLADDRIAAGSCLAVLPGSGLTTVAYGTRLFGRMRVRGIRQYPSAEGQYPTPENLASAVELAVNDLHAPREGVTLVVPKAWVIVKTADLPPAVRENLPGVVSYELDRLTPLSAERAFYAFRVLDEGPDRIRIVLAAVKTDVLEPYLEALQKKGIVVRRAAVSLSALGTLSRYLHGEGDAVFAEVGPGGCYEGGLLRRGRWEGAFAGKTASASSDDGIVAAEVDALVDLVKRQGGAPPAVYIHDPAKGREWPGLQGGGRGAGFLDREKAGDPPYAVLGGLMESLWAGADGMDLLGKGGSPSSKIPAAPTFALLAVLAVLGLFWLLSPLQDKDNEIRAIDRELADRREEARRIETLRNSLEGIEKEIDAIETFKSSRTMTLDLFREMTAVLPKDTWLSRLRITDSTVEIEGYAASATEILPKLEASGHFKRVEFAASTSRDTRLNADRFTIKMEIEREAEKEAGDEKKQ
ncbi:MAG TPA: PilN domain-containing protein [Syntrophales bacterium]|nr:PilN domain-containing protein [Syntrophales bacterium]